MFKLFAATISIFISIAVLLPVIPHYVHDVFGANDFIVGIEMAMQAIGAISSRMIVGNIIARAGTRYAVVLGSYICAIGCSAYFLPPSLFLLGLARFMQGVGEGFVFTSGTTWMLNAAPRGKRGQYVAWFGLALWLGAALAPPLGAFFTSHYGYTGAWIAATAAAVSGVLLSHWTRHPHITVVTSLESLNRKKLEWMAKESLRPGVLLCLASSGFVAIATFATLYFASKGWAGGALPITAFGMGFVLMRSFGGGWLDRQTLFKVVMFSTTLEACGLLGIALAPNAATAIFCALLSGMGLALMYPSLAVAATNGVPVQRQGTVIAWFTAFWDLSLLLSNILFGWIATLWGYQAVYIGGLAGTLLAMMLMRGWRNTLKK